MATGIAIASLLVAATGTAVAAKQGSIANKRAKAAQAAQALEAREQTAALQALEAEPVPTIPGADDDAVRRQRRRSISRQLGRRGRQGTILTSPESRGVGLGG